MSGLVVDRLSIYDRSGQRLLGPLSFTLPRGAVLVLIGESGAGKSLVCAAIAGTLPAELAAQGRIALDGIDLTRLSRAQRRAGWSRDLFLLPQEPWSALAPSRAAAEQVADMPRLYAREPSWLARTSGRRLLARVGLLSDTDAVKRPAQLSGGMCQRVAVATALGAPAPLILVDEPTKGLDATRRDEIAANLRLLRDEGRAMLVVTHDLELARMLGGRIAVMRDGAVVEEGETNAVLASPAHPFTQALVEADPANWPRRSWRPGAAVVALSNVAVRAGERGPILVEGLSMEVAAGDVVGLVGPSGSGKTTIGNTLLKLKPPAAGRVIWADGARRRFQKLYQEPGAAFAPWRTIGATLADALAAAGRPRAQVERAASPLLHRLGLPRALLARRPGEVSGGELQRLGLVRALLCDPLFLFADEPTSRLDALTQKNAMALLAELVGERALAVLLVSHDPALVGSLASRTTEIACRDHSATVGSTRMLHKEDA